MGLASRLDRRTGSQPISREVQDDLALIPEELTRLVNVVNVHVKLLARPPHISLDVNAIPRLCRAPSSRRQIVLIPAKDSAWEGVLDDQLIRNESRDVAGRAHETEAMAGFGVFFPPARFKESRARIEEVRLRMREEVTIANGPRTLEFPRN
jgi:hypothetical protein